MIINPKYLVLLLIFAFQLSFGQSDSSRSLNKEDFLKAKEGYLKMSESSIYLEARTLTIDFINNLGDVDNADFLISPETFAKWINENIKTTKYKSIEDAIAAWKKITDLNEKLASENFETYKLITLASSEQLKIILAPDMLSESELAK